MLLAMGAIGLRALAGLWAWPSAHRPPGANLAGFAVVEALAVVLMVAGRRGAGADPVGSRWRRWLSAGYVFLILGVPLAMLLVTAVRVPGTGEPFPLPTPSPSPLEPVPSEPDPTLLPPLPGREESSWTGGWMILLAALVVLGVSAVVWSVAGRRPRGAPPVPSPVPPRPAAFDEAAAAGSLVLRSTGDPRAAVVACYTVMESVLAEAGAAPRSSDTPGEVLARASGAGLAGLDAAATLTQLFREARYSVHPVTERHRAEALAALESLRARSRA
ncbi:DUF4129 domain-containing protein [Actinomadura formosensis]|uniref:DUF4129 domain-containing protein n=1 Tax=Actinomadura formosensis TaxID=60706 RepID=UPI003D93A4BB